jgi:Glycosyl transferase family 2
VIPTRDRPDTLRVTLRTLVHQTSDRIEIVVQDNSVEPLTAEVVAEARLRDPRIRYSRTPHSSSQRQNFEFGLQAARGDYLTIIGDDDGFCLGSLDWLVAQLNDHPVDAVRWTLVFYVWPSLSTDGKGFIKLYPAQCYGKSSVAPAAPIAAAALKAMTVGSWDNILVYHGMISRKVYDRMRKMTDGVFFAYPMPDVYAHNVLPHFCERILQVDDIVSIYGMSGHSAGASWTRALDMMEPGSAVGQRWMADSIADPVAAAQPWHPEIRTLRYHDFAACKLAEAHGMLPGKSIDTKIWIKAIIAEIKGSPWQLDAWFKAVEKAPFDAEIFSAVRKRFAKDRNKPVALPPHKHEPETQVPAVRIAGIDGMLADDIEGACLAISRLTADELPRYQPVCAPPPRWIQRLSSRLAKGFGSPGEKRARMLQLKLDAMKPPANSPGSE